MPLPYTAKRAESLAPPTKRPLDRPTQESVEAIAGAIERVGMSSVASMLLWTFKPAAWAGGQLLWAMQPLFGGARHDSPMSITNLASFLEDEQNIEALAERLVRGCEGGTDRAVDGR